MNKVIKMEILNKKIKNNKMIRYKAAIKTQ